MDLDPARWMHPNLPDEEVLEFLNSGTDKLSNRYPDIKSLAHKEAFANAMRVCMDLDPEGFDFIPPSFTLPSPIDSQRLLEYQAKHKNATYIAKPWKGGQGDSISLFKEMRDLPFT